MDSSLAEDRSPVSRYTSFLLRCWRVGGDERRIEIEQIQTGGRRRVHKLGAALAWIDDRCGRTFGPNGSASSEMPGDASAAMEKWPCSGS